EVDQAVESHVEARFLPGLPDCGDGDLFSTIDVAAREHPQSVARFDRPSDENDSVVCRGDDGADRDFGIEVVDVAAAAAHEARRIAGFQLPCFEGASTSRAESERGFLHHGSRAIPRLYPISTNSPTASHHIIRICPS